MLFILSLLGIFYTYPIYKYYCWDNPFTMVNFCEKAVLRYHQFASICINLIGLFLPIRKGRYGFEIQGKKFKARRMSL